MASVFVLSKADDQSVDCKSERRIEEAEQEWTNLFLLICRDASAAMAMAMEQGLEGSNEEARPLPLLFEWFQSTNWSGIEEVRQDWGGAKERGARCLGAPCMIQENILLHAIIVLAQTDGFLIAWLLNHVFTLR
jgi:hypothetical protein